MSYTPNISSLIHPLSLWVKLITYVAQPLNQVTLREWISNSGTQNTTIATKTAWQQQLLHGKKIGRGGGELTQKSISCQNHFFSSHQHHKMSLKSWEDKINAWCLELFMTASVSVYMEWPNSLLHSLGPYFTLSGLAWCTAGTCGSPCHRKPSTFLPTLPRTPFHLSLGPSVPAPVMPQDNTAALPTAWCPSPASGHPRAVSVPHLCLFFFLLPFKNRPSCTGRLEPTGKQIISPAFISIQFILFTSSFAVSWIKR